MGNHVLSVDFFGNSVRAETQGRLVCINDLVRAGNNWRAVNGLPLKTVQQVMVSQGLADYMESASKVWGIPKDDLIVVVGKGSKSRTMGHIAVAIYVAEQLSPEFHANVIKTFIEGKLMEFRDMGGTEFKNLNAAIDLYLPEREGKDNTGIYIQAAKAIRKKLMGDDACSGCWDKASVAQTHSRYEIEKSLVQMLSIGLVRDYYHLKEIIERL